MRINKKLKLASRKSDLARWQAVTVAKHLEALPEKPEIEFNFKSSFGDQNLDIPLAGMGARGVFTEDFYKDLADGACDLVVHSWKDLPIQEREGTKIAMTLPRADVRDLLLIPHSVWQKALQTKKLTVLTSSPRRIYNLESALPQLLPGDLQITFRNVRGNVPTRLQKMYDEDAALILAKAGLDRLLEAEATGFTNTSLRKVVNDCRFQVLPVSLNPPAPAQGALAVEISRQNAELDALCARLNHEVTFKSVQAERSVLNQYGGGCHQKIGVARLPKPYGMVCALRGLTEAGQVLHEWRIENSTPWTKASQRNKIFPHQAKDNSWFERQTLPVDNTIKEYGGLFVGRAEAWPQNYQPDQQLVWTAGVKTWFKLAQAGVFVNGCQDGLGEQEGFQIDSLAGPQKWCKLSHEVGPGTTIATYKLLPKNEVPNLTGCTHFYWMSRTSFEAAYKRFPNEISAGFNACGPGHTYEFLKTHAELKNPVKVFIGLEQFLHESLPST